MYPIEYLWRAARCFPDRVAVIGGGHEIAYQTLAQMVIEKASGLVAVDAPVGSVVCLGAANNIAHLVGILAILAAGKVWVPLNPRNGDPELKRLIEFVQPALVLVDPSMSERVPDEAGTWQLLAGSSLSG